MEHKKFVINKAKTVTFLLVASFLGLLFNTNLDFIGAPSYITSVRLSILVLLTISLLLSNVLPTLIFNSFKNKIVFYGGVNVCYIVISLSISHIFNGAETQQGTAYVISGYMQLISYIIFAGLILYINVDYFIKSLIVLSTLICLFWLYSLKKEYSGSIMDFFIIRQHLNDTLPQGLNRFLNGMVILQVLPLAVLMKIVSVPKGYKLFSLFIFLVGMLFAFISGSRQFLISFILLIIGIFYIRSHYSFSIIRSFITLLFITLPVVIIYMNLPVEYLETISRRLFDVTQEQIEGGSDRGDLYSTIINLLTHNAFLGLGPGGFYAATGRYPDSGYLQFLVEQGIVQFTFHLFFIVVIVTSLIKNRKKMSPLSLSFSLAFCINIIIQNFFNELFLEYYTWLIIPMIFIFNKVSIIPKKI